MLDRLRARAQRSDEGFTLIELLIVIVILGILAAIVVFAVGNSTNQAKASACNADQKTVQTALEAFKANSPTGVYPPASAVPATATDVAAVNAGPGGALLKSTPPSSEGISWSAAGVITATGTGCTALS